MLIKLRQKIAITNEDGKILVLWAPKGKVWDLPGGHVDLPEIHTDALKREILEELGLVDFPEPKLIFLYTNYKPETDRYAIIVCYQITMNEPIKRLSDEHTEYKWVTKNELRAIVEKELYVTPLIEHIE